LKDINISEERAASNLKLQGGGSRFLRSISFEKGAVGTTLLNI